MMTQKKASTIWLDGNFIPSSDATVSLKTHALHYASSVFEGIRSYKGRLFKVHEHYQRLHKSAEGLGFQLPYSANVLEEATRELVTRENYEYGYIRALGWCGTRKLTVESRGIDVHVAIMGWERPINRNRPAIRLIESRWRRPDPRTAPVHSKAAGLYMISSMSRNEAESQGYDDALLLDYRGYIAEASSSNIFFVIGSKLVTPIPHSFLNGITRLTVIDLASQLGITVEEREVLLSDLQDATEAFLTGTSIEVLSIKEIKTHQANYTFNDETITNRLKEAFYKLVT